MSELFSLQPKRFVLHPKRLVLNAQIGGEAFAASSRRSRDRIVVVGEWPVAVAGGV
jgi:hypothetical protein